MYKISLTFISIVLFSSISVAKIVGTIECKNPKAKLAIRGNVFSSLQSISYANLTLSYRDKTYIYKASLTPQSSLFMELSSKQNGGLLLEVFGDDMGLMSSVQLGKNPAINITCSYQDSY